MSHSHKLDTTKVVGTVLSFLQCIHCTTKRYGMKNGLGFYSNVNEWTYQRKFHVILPVESAIIIVKMEDEKLIKAVRSFPCLWNVNGQAHKDARAKENAWREVSTLFRRHYTG